jgi:uncharacterized membrane-anchored protein YjiN (DUF445 family)
MRAGALELKHIASERRLAELKRMRAVATGLLVAMFAVFVAATVWDWAYVKAFAEAAMVGACADWFAVVALFRRPFGLPIPHTAIIPRNKERIGESLGHFICNNFLAPEVVAARLDSVDAAGRIAAWLAEPANARALARRAANLLPPLLDALEEEDVRRFVRDAARGGLENVAAAPLAARILSVLVAGGHHQRLFDRILEGAERFLLGHEANIRARVSSHSYRWLPRWVDEKLGDKVVYGLMDTLAEMRDLGHPWRDEFQAQLEELIGRLASEPELMARGEAIKAEVLKNPIVEQYLDSLWSVIKARLRGDLAAEEGLVRRGLEQALLGLGQRLRGDARVRRVVNRWIARAVERHVVPHRGEIGAFISSVVARWDARTLVAKLELQVGKDLQYIRINGTLVGGLVGLGIYAISHALR